ncbi:MAG: acyl carrier protein [Candidatus Omnitrophica bacterium]|nr:acyl carrier protein [Candidatus Omnitrophota bacterium]MCK5287960.1 acyl carrier protein [Candidatus Omnitrophota bacterium]
MSSQSLNDIKKKLTEEVAMILCQNIQAISADEPLHDMGLDSLSFVELLVSIEKNFNLTLINTNLAKEDFSTINTLTQRLFEAINE